MIDKTRIKIVKKTDALAAKAKLKKRKKSTSRTAARELVTTVTEWVADLKERKTIETKAALDLLFSANQSTIES